MICNPGVRLNELPMKPRHFTIRDLLWLMLVGAILCGRWIEHRERASERRELLELRKREAIQRHWASAWLPPPGASVRDGFQVDAF
jgi:hypothetical protein